MKTVKNPGKRSGCPGGRVKVGDLVKLKAQFDYGIGIARFCHNPEQPPANRLWRSHWVLPDGRPLQEWDELESNLVVVSSAAKCFGRI